MNYGFSENQDNLNKSSEHFRASFDSKIYQQVNLRHSQNSISNKQEILKRSAKRAFSSNSFRTKCQKQYTPGKVSVQNHRSHSYQQAGIRVGPKKPKPSQRRSRQAKSKPLCSKCVQQKTCNNHKFTKIAKKFERLQQPQMGNEYKPSKKQRHPNLLLKGTKKERNLFTPSKNSSKLFNKGLVYGTRRENEMEPSQRTNVAQISPMHQKSFISSSWGRQAPTKRPETMLNQRCSNPQPHKLNLNLVINHENMTIRPDSAMTASEPTTFQNIKH